MNLSNGKGNKTIMVGSKDRLINVIYILSTNNWISFNVNYLDFISKL